MRVASRTATSFFILFVWIVEAADDRMVIDVDELPAAFCNVDSNSDSSALLLIIDDDDDDDAAPETDSI